VPPNNNTICIVGATNSSTQYPAWTIVRSSVPLTINYAGYVIATSSLQGVTSITFTVQCVDSKGGSTATATFTVPVIQVSAQLPVRNPLVFSNVPTSGLILSNKFLTGSSAVVGYNIANNTASTSVAEYIKFVQTFKQGDVPKGNTVSLVSPGNITNQIQVDPINTYSDGSLKSAVITTFQQPIAPGVITNYLLASSAAPSTIPTPISIETALSSYSLAFNIQMLNDDGTNNGSLLTFDLVAAIQYGLKNNTISYFQQGPLVTQGRVVLLLSGSLYLNIDISVFSDKSVVTDISVRNDIAMSASGGPVYSSGTIVKNGVTVYKWNNLYQNQYQAWFFECRDHFNAMSVQIDPAYLIKNYTIQPYNITNGVNATTIQGYASAMTQAGWLSPLNTNNVDTGMPGTGGRPDIGYITQSATVALITQNPIAIDYCCAQAEASGSAPWNLYDMANKCWLNTINYPNMWADQSNRGGVGTPGDASSGGLTQPNTVNSESWSLDQAHQPDLSFVPYIYTGRRAYLDQVLMQGAWSVVGQYNRAMTIPGTSTVIQQSLWGDQVRGIAWTLRQVSNAGFLAPDNTVYSTYFAEIMAQNATYALGMQTYLQSQQGSCYGYLAQLHGGNNFAPWEQNYLQPICALAGARGYPNWTTIASWFARFTVESFLPQTDGPYKGMNWCQRDGASYDLFTGVSNNSQSGAAVIFTAQTWAEMGYWTVLGGQSNSGATYNSTTDTISAGTENWSHSQGDYGQLCLAVLNWAVILNLPNASTALAWLNNSGAPYIDTGTFQNDPTFSLAA
jgi:hypothetical protein